MSFHKIKKEYKVKNIFILLAVFLLLTITGFISKLTKCSPEDNGGSVIPVAKADVPTPSVSDPYTSCGSSAGCDGGSSCSGSSY